MAASASLLLDDWADKQARLSSAHMALGVSATSLVMNRAGFGHTIKPAPGSVLAAIGSALTESEPDYFFHWLRDSAAIMDAALILIQHGIDADAWRQRFAEFLTFSLGLRGISGRQFLREVDFRTPTAPLMQQFLRPDEEIAAIEGSRVLGEVRYNADGTLDFLRWSRPQHDGPAARALAVLRFWEADAIPGEARGKAAELIRLDLDYTRNHLCQPCYDIWEEESAQHYYTCLVQYAALRKGAAWAQALGDNADAAELEEAVADLPERLDDFWSAEKGIYRSRIMPAGQTTPKELDLASILGVLHAGLASGAHSIADARVLSTLNRLEDLFAADYALNKASGAGLALGRYKGDTYFSGGAYFFCTLGAAEFYYKRAAAIGDPALIDRGDAILAMARRSIPESGEMSEQFDQTTGEQTSAKSLTWSYAAFITAWDARLRAQAALPRSAA